MKLLCEKIIFVFLVIGTFIACGGGGLSGTWEEEGGSTDGRGQTLGAGIAAKCRTTLKLSGKSFTYTDCFDSLNQYPSYMSEYILYTEKEFAEKEFLDKKAGSDLSYFLITAKGTYSITGNKIEFVLSNGKVKVSDVEYTENTLKLNDVRPKEFIRSKR